MKMHRIGGLGALGAMVAVGVGGPAREASAQAQATAPPPAASAAAPAPPAETAGLARQMAEQMRRLAQDTSSSMEPSEVKNRLVQDIQELAQAVDEFEASLRDRPDSFRVRQAFLHFDPSWHHLAAQLAQPGVSTFVMRRAATSAEEIDARLHKALDVNAPPPEYYAQGPVPTGLVETRRLARTLDDRARYLAAVVQADVPPNTTLRDQLVRRTVDLARATDLYLDSLPGIADNNLAQTGFAPVAAVADQVEQSTVDNRPPGRVLDACKPFAAAYTLIREHLGLPVPPPGGAVRVAPPPGGGPSPVLPLADRLLGQVDAFLNAFLQNAANVPEGGYFLDDAQRLRAAVADFRQDAARGMSAGQLAFEFRDVDVLWLRLARRINRVARGRAGPNIQTAYRIGDTCAQIHQMLGMPGYPPALVTVPQ